jgi:hypothetical protein
LRGLREVVWVELRAGGLTKLGIAYGFCVSRGLEFGMPIGWHGDLSESDGCGMRIASLAFARNRRCAGFSVIRKHG